MCIKGFSLTDPYCPAGFILPPIYIYRTVSHVYMVLDFNERIVH